jgi:hypothetical protein
LTWFLPVVLGMRNNKTIFMWWRKAFDYTLSYICVCWFNEYSNKGEGNNNIPHHYRSNMLFTFYSHCCWGFSSTLSDQYLWFFLLFVCKYCYDVISICHWLWSC